MAHENKVLRSIETVDGGRCVHVFVRPDASYGFEESRRDVEDGRGWFPTGHHAGRVFETEQAALADALSKVAWLATIVNSD